MDTKVKAEEEEGGKSFPKDKGKAKVEDVDAMPIKRARQEEAAMNETGERRKSKENGESSSKKKPKPRQKITIKDFALGESSQPYNLVDDVSVQGPKITWPQLLHLAPKVHRQWTMMVSTQRVKTKAMGLVSGRHLQDITPVLNAYVKGQRVSNVYVDKGAQICVMMCGRQSLVSQDWKEENLVKEFVGAQSLPRLENQDVGAATSEPLKATGKAGGGLVLHDSNGEIVMKKHVKLPDSTSNNEAEYDILLHGLQVCVSQKIRRLMVKGDALLIVKQILGIWACKNERLREKVQAIRRLFNQFEEVQLYHIPRKQNEVADLLAQKAVACDESEVQVILAATAIKQPRYQGMESLAPIVSYILEGEFPQCFTKTQKQRLMEKASSYLFLEGALYQRGKDQVCRRIPTVEEIPSILEVNGNKHLLHGPRQLVLANGPFEKWGIDAMGPLPRTKNGKLYILVAIDYMTRWVEAQSVTRVNEKTVSRFVYTHICCRFGTPLEIVSDNGPGFRKGLLTEVCEELHILHRHSTPYYPQSNGLVEKANGIIAEIIRKMVKNKTKLWDDFLDGALWAYRTTYKEATEFTPFHLVYGQEALQPIELNIPTMRLHGKATQRKEEEWTDHLLTLAELEWKREVAYECYKRKATQVKDKLDKEVKDKGIKEGDLVLRYDNRLDNRFDAKFETRWQGPYIVKKAFNPSYYQLMDLDGKEHPRKVNGYRLKPYLSRILPKDLQDQRQKSTLSNKSCSLDEEQGAKQGNIPGYQEDVEEAGNPGTQERITQRFIPGIQEKKGGEGIFGTQEKRAMRRSISGNQEREEEGRIPGTQGREETQNTPGNQDKKEECINAESQGKTLQRSLHGDQERIEQ
ncbi:hypothetical protein L7F22_056005 [Adiantum nelumboides]|nr:hypothetical protein [Adiantum nelumboides]